MAISEKSRAAQVPGYKIVKRLDHGYLRVGFPAEYLKILNGPEVHDFDGSATRVMLAQNLRNNEQTFVVCDMEFDHLLDTHYPNSSYVGRSFMVRKKRIGNIVHLEACEITMDDYAVDSGGDAE